MSQPREAVPEIVRRLLQRVGDELAAEPLGLPAEEHRGRLSSLFARLGEMSHYELLDLRPDPAPEEVYDGFHRLARLAHPSHAERLNLTGREKVLELLFERAVTAYLTLSDREARRAYDLDWGPRGEAIPEEQQQEERRRSARNHYERARQLVEQESFHFAVELLKEAARLDPQPGYFALLGEAQAHNPNWLRQAADSFRRALKLGGDEPRVHLGLARALEGLGRQEEARRHYRLVLAALPGEPDAEAALERLAGGEEERPPGGGWRRFLGGGEG